MKQGTVVNRVVMFALLGAVLFYLGVTAWQSVAGQTQTVRCYAYTLDDQQEVTGYLVRSELPLPAQSGLVDVLLAEGEKVGVGQTVANLYRDASALERKQELHTLTLQYDQLSYSLSRPDDLSDNARLTEEIMEGISQLRAAVAQRDFTDLEDHTMELKSLVYKREYSLASGEDLTGMQAALDGLKAQIETLTASAQQDTTSIGAPQAGTFSGLVDGYERVLTPDALEGLTPSDLDALPGRGESVASGSYGKLITDAKWYFVCALPEETVKRLAEGWTVDVRFSRDWSGVVDMHVERIGLPENGRAVVVFSSSDHLSDVTLLRRQTVDIVFSSVTGIRVPKNALCRGEEGNWGVYALVGAQAEFKPVTIVGSDEEYYLVKAEIPEGEERNDRVTRKALRVGDQILLTVDGVYDGKVIQ